MFERLGPATTILLLTNVLVFLMQGVVPQVIFQFALWPLGYGFELWQLLSYAFLHGSLAHIAFNMVGLITFGSELERHWGTRAFLQVYFASVLTAACAQLAVTAAGGELAPTVGASGGIFGLLLGFAVMFPRRKVVPLIPPIPMPAWLFAALFGTLELLMGVTGTARGIAHFAHLGGMLGAALVLLRWRQRSTGDSS